MKTTLHKIIRSPLIHARFINTLSLLEYIGARKIIKSQQQTQITVDILAHMVEELRHAQILKRAALKLAPQLCATYAPEALFCGEAACRYIQTLDHAAEKLFNERDPWPSYLYTTLLIEERANKVYPQIDKVLQENGKPTLFRGILVEEERHLQEINHCLKTIPDAENRATILRPIEQNAFADFVSAMEEALSMQVT